MTNDSKTDSTLCILVTCSPESGKIRTLIKIAEASISMGHRVQIFLMDDGVYQIRNRDFLALIPKGSEVVLCAHNALERGLEKQEGVLFGSQYDFSVMVSASDGFLALT